jgi:cytochrome c oxidase cbb3-type subunit 2
MFVYSLNGRARAGGNKHLNASGREYTVLAEAPEKSRGRRNPFEGNLRAASAGNKLFTQHCAQCHGSNAEGGMRGPSLHNDEVRQAAPGTLFWLLTNGVVRRGMPVWSKLPEPQRWQIVTYLQRQNRTPISTGN